MHRGGPHRRRHRVPGDLPPGQRPGAGVLPSGSGTAPTVPPEPGRRSSRMPPSSPPPSCQCRCKGPPTTGRSPIPAAAVSGPQMAPGRNGETPSPGERAAGADAPPSRDRLICQASGRSSRDLRPCPMGAGLDPAIVRCFADMTIRSFIARLACALTPPRRPPGTAGTLSPAGSYFRPGRPGPLALCGRARTAHPASKAICVKGIHPSAPSPGSGGSDGTGALDGGP